MIHILSTTIVPAGDGELMVHIASLEGAEAAERILTSHGGWEGHPAWQSHVGHESTAALMSDLLGHTIVADRTPLALPERGQVVECLVMQVAGRPPEGRILTREELEALGVTWRYMRIMRLA